MKLAAISTALMLAFAASSASAGDFNKSGTWSVSAGVHNVDVDSERGSRVEDSTRGSASVEYFVLDNVGVELFMTAPTKHHIGADGFGRVASTKVFQPTVSVKYHFDTNTNWSPFVGLGAAYTNFSSERFNAASGLDFVPASLDSTWSPAATVGVDYRFGANSAVRADLRYTDGNSRVRVDGFDLGRTKYDTLSYGVSYVHQF